MKIQGSKGLFTRESKTMERLDNANISKRVSLSKKKSIFVGDSNFSNDNLIIKKQRAQKRAWKVIMDAHKGEKKLDDDLKKRQNNITRYEEQQKFWKEEIDKTMGAINGLREIYGVTEDSQEQKDLEALMRRENLLYKKGYNELTQEEFQFLEETEGLQDLPLTDYQKEAMKMYEMVNLRGNRELIIAKRKSEAEKKTINNIINERAKSPGIINAVKEAESIMETSYKEAVGMLMDEAKEHMDTKREEKEKTTKEKAKKEEEEKEKLEAAKEGRKKREELELEDLISESNHSALIQDKIQSQLKKIMMEEVVVEADLKGISVNEHC